MEDCQLCGSNNNLQEHHISYNPPQIILLCRKCHQEQHPKHGVGLASFQKIDIPKDFSIAWQNLTYRDIMKKYGISYATVHNWAKKLTLRRKISKYASVVKKAVSFQKPIYDKLQQYRGEYIAKTTKSMTFSAALNEVLEEGLKVKGRWAKSE